MVTRGIPALACGALAAVLAACGSATSTTPDTTAGGSSAASATSTAAAGGPIVVKVGDGDTEHVRAKDGVTVDTLTWHVTRARSRKVIGDSVGAQTADGIYVITTAKVTNNKSKSVTINSDIATFVAAGKQYKPDNDGETALLLTGAKSFFLKDLGPDVTTNGSIVFDVPPATLKQRPEVCFGELGFGDSKGCIRVVVTPAK